MARKRVTKRSAELWQLIHAAVLDVHDRNIAVLSSQGLTGGEIKSLVKLTPGEGVPMRALAEMWRSDASTVTWMVDRLEDKGLVERRPLPGDRRVRVVALTAAGEAELAAIRARLYEPPDWWGTLDSADLDQVGRLADHIRAARAAEAP